MSWSEAVPLPEVFQFIHAQLVTCQVKQGIKQHRSMTCREDKTITIFPVGIIRIIAKELIPQHKGHISHSHRSTGVTRFRFFYCIRRQKTDGIDTAFS